MAQPAEPMVSAAELPSGAAAHAPSCWLIAGIVIELSAAATTGAPMPAASAMAIATARRRAVGLGSFTDGKFRPDKRGPSWAQAQGANKRGEWGEVPGLVRPQMCQPRQCGKGGATVPSRRGLLRLLDAQSQAVFRAGKEINKTGARSTQRSWGVFGGGE